MSFDAGEMSGKGCPSGSTPGGLSKSITQDLAVSILKLYRRKNDIKLHVVLRGFLAKD